ncbi:MAG: calcium-binding protein [Alphaproteobacteria bacterium]
MTMQPSKTTGADATIADLQALAEAEWRLWPTDAAEEGGDGPTMTKGMVSGSWGETEPPGDMVWKLPDGVRAVRIAPGNGETTQGSDGDDVIVADPSGPLSETGHKAPPAYDNVIHGGDGDDEIYGGAGDDRLFGGDGEDWIYGGDGDDYIDGGGDSWDNLHGGAGNDTILGGADRDILNGDDGNDWLMGGADSDDLYGDDGNDILEGGAGDDLLSGGDGQDEMYGGAGADRFVNVNHDGLFDIVHDYDVSQLDTVRGLYYDVDENGHTRVYDDNDQVTLVLADYDAISQGILLEW